MSEYFSYFPTTKHDLTNVGQTVELTNILRRFIVRSDVTDRADVYYQYDVQAGDRPDTIAEKVYGDADLAWLVLHFNNIIDPVFGWALFNEDFTQYIKSKYGSVATAQATVHEYRQVLREAEVLYDGTRIPKKYVVVDEDTYISLNESVRELITKYDWEVEENEKKRTIKILDARFLDKIRDEVKVVLKDGI
jgi:hypothetical protein